MLYRRRHRAGGKQLLPLRTPMQAFAAGLLWAFMPCGLLYGAIALAMSASSPLLGAATMVAAVGLGTLPVMLAVGLLTRRVVGAFARGWVRRSAGAVISPVASSRRRASPVRWGSEAHAASPAPLNAKRRAHSFTASRSVSGLPVSMSIPRSIHRTRGRPGALVGRDVHPFEHRASASDHDLRGPSTLPAEDADRSVARSVEVEEPPVVRLGSHFESVSASIERRQSLATPVFGMKHPVGDDGVPRIELVAGREHGVVCTVFAFLLKFDPEQSLIHRGSHRRRRQQEPCGRLRARRDGSCRESQRAEVVATTVPGAVAFATLRRIISVASIQG